MNQGLLNAGQILLPTEPLKLMHFLCKVVADAQFAVAAAKVATSVLHTVSALSLKSITIPYICMNAHTQNHFTHMCVVCVYIYNMAVDPPQQYSDVDCEELYS